MVKLNPQLLAEVQKYKSYVIIVEGKKDLNSLKNLGFEKVYAVHEPSVSLRERIEKISLLINKKDKICILTDFDKKGKQLYLLIKSEIQTIGGIRLDSSLRGILLKARVSHIEGLSKFMERLES
jgi:5S rRNA maturation endonuclease (ribonuclease M5)